MHATSLLPTLSGKIVMACLELLIFKDVIFHEPKPQIMEGTLKRQRCTALQHNLAKPLALINQLPFAAMIRRYVSNTVFPCPSYALVSGSFQCFIDDGRFLHINGDRSSTLQR